MKHLAILAFLLIASISYAQTSLETTSSEVQISPDDVENGDIEAVQATIQKGAIIDRQTVDLFLSAILDYHQYEVAYVLLDTLFNHRIDVVNCLYVTELSNGRIVRMPPTESRRYTGHFMDYQLHNNLNLTDIQRVHLRNIKRLLLGQDFENPDSCESIDDRLHVGTLFLQSR